jgi:hypothetical protein
MCEPDTCEIYESKSGFAIETVPAAMVFGCYLTLAELPSEAEHYGEIIRVRGKEMKVFAFEEVGDVYLVGDNRTLKVEWGDEFKRWNYKKYRSCGNFSGHPSRDIGGSPVMKGRDIKALYGT